jgi:cytochrome c oxidase cbb3-type subunit 3
MRLAHALCVLSVLSLVTSAAASRGESSALQAQQPASLPSFDQMAVERGRELLVARCGFCHGANARGGQGGPDLTRSALVQDDEDGKQLGEFLRVGRPDAGMPKFELPQEPLSDLATFLHATVYLAANRRFYQILDIVIGDARAGEAFFNGAGQCSGCHSVTGDLKGVGGKYDPATLQNRLVMPRGGRGAAPAPGSVPPAYLDRNAIKVTVTLPAGQSFSGALVRVTDFDVTLYDPATEQVRSWFRSGDVPRVTVVDPLQAHVDMWTRWTDADMHNVTAYLAGLK